MSLMDEDMEEETREYRYEETGAHWSGPLGGKEGELKASDTMKKKQPHRNWTILKLNP